MRALLKAMIIFWLGLVPLAFLILVLGPMFAKPAAPYVEGRCDAACMDRMLAP